LSGQRLSQRPYRRPSRRQRRSQKAIASRCWFRSAEQTPRRQIDRHAANLALADSGAGAGIRLTVYDTARGASRAANQALRRGTACSWGPLLAEDVRAVAPVARRADVPVVTFSNDVSVAGNGVYLLGFVPSQSIERVVRHARSAGVQRFAGLVPSGTYGQRRVRR
jgi:outer membrane PBP1 activator LpoA protein